MLIDALDLPLPRWPAVLEGLRVAHVSDTHCRRQRDRHDRLVRELADAQPDLLLLTGDYMSHPGDEPFALSLLHQLAERVRAPLGLFGVFGNHDSPKLIRQATEQVPAIRWLINDAVRLEVPGVPSKDAGEVIDLWGLHVQSGRPADAVALSLAVSAPGQPAPTNPHDLARPPRLMLSHYPQTLAQAADLGIDAVFAGHTHGGQVRLPNGRALRNSSSLPLHLTAGKLRHRRSVALVSRGLGEMTLPLRMFCPPHAPLYTIQQGDLPDPPHGGISRLWHW
jgi:hypothetical protein